MVAGYDTDSSDSPNKKSLSHSVISINEQNKDIFHQRVINPNSSKVLKAINQNHKQDFFASRNQKPLYAKSSIN